MTRLRRFIIVSLCAAAAAAGCDREAPAAENRDLGSRVAGSWTVRLTVDRLPFLAARTTAREQSLVGTFAFVPSTDPADRSAAAYGVYDVDFARLGLAQRRGAPAATVLAVQQDSVEIRLDPMNDETVIVLRGLVQGDSVLGTWTVSVPRVTQGGGRFVMVRRRER
jgi:hypothetical protein